MSTPTSTVRHLTSVHAVGDTRILHKECRGLAASGHDVALIACHDRDETIEGVRIIAVVPPRNRFDRFTRAAWHVYRAARRERADIYHLHDPELIWVGVLLKLGGGKVIWDVHEDVPKQIMNKFWIPPWARRILSTGAMVAERLAARAFDAIVTATPTIAEKFPPEKTVVVQNFPESSIASSSEQDPPFDERPHAFVYTGGLTAVQGLREMIEAFSQLPDGEVGVVAGRFDTDALEAEAKASPGWESVRYVGQLSRSDVIAAMRSARCGIVIDLPISNYLDAYSTKLFEYMACGLPVVCSDLPLQARLVSEADCGIVVDPADSQAVAGAIRRLCEHPDEARRLGENGRAAIVSRFNWEAELAKLNGLYADRLHHNGHNGNGVRAGALHTPR